MFWWACTQGMLLYTILDLPGSNVKKVTFAEMDTNPYAYYQKKSGWSLVPWDHFCPAATELNRTIAEL